jgi:hypothetical protein
MIPGLFQKIKKEIIWRIERFSKDTAYPIKPEKLVVDVINTLDQDDIVISDVGAQLILTRALLPLKLTRIAVLSLHYRSRHISANIYRGLNFIRMIN